jgi:hypothetical protein
LLIIGAYVLPVPKEFCSIGGVNETLYIKPVLFANIDQAKRRKIFQWLRENSSRARPATLMDCIFWKIWRF